MNLVTIVADSAAEALAEIHRQLGPHAVVVNVRKTPAPGLSGIWKKGKIEVQATLPAAAAPSVAPKKPKKEILSPIQQPPEPRPRTPSLLDSPTLAARRRPAPKPRLEEHELSAPPSPDFEPGSRSRVPLQRASGELDLGSMLDNLGILPLHAQWLVDQVRSREPREQPKDLREEFQKVQEFLLEYWDRLAARARNVACGTRVFVGAPGVGKTTCLCKWLTQEVLVRNQPARVWRLDTHTANTAEFLSIHGEILGVPVERIWSNETLIDQAETQFVDVPGVSTDNPDAILALAEQVKLFKTPSLFLVLNAAYDLNHLFAQARAFAGLPLTGIILSHLDEDNRWSKFWNLLLGTKLPILYLSGGQNIPGQFSPASPQSLFDVLPDA
jgi:flagellar biosynthesis protein FlhF